MSEKNFWNLVRNNLDLKMYRVENRVAVGMPDVHYISEKSSGWIELKFIPILPKKGKIKTCTLTREELSDLIPGCFSVLIAEELFSLMALCANQYQKGKLFAI